MKQAAWRGEERRDSGGDWMVEPSPPEGPARMDALMPGSLGTFTSHTAFPKFGFRWT